MGRTRSFGQGFGSGRCLAEIGILVRVTQRPCVCRAWRPRGEGNRQAGGPGAQREASWDQQKLSPVTGEGGVVSQVVMVIGQLTRCKDLFWSIVSCLDADGKIQPKLDFLGSL